MKIALLKVALSAIASGLIILVLYGVARFSDSDNPMFFFDMGMSALSLIALLTTIGILISAIFRSANKDLAIFSATSCLVSDVVLVLVYRSGVSLLFYLIVGVNLLVSIILGILLYQTFQNKKKSAATHP